MMLLLHVLGHSRVASAKSFDTVVRPQRLPARPSPDCGGSTSGFSGRERTSALAWRLRAALDVGIAVGLDLGDALVFLVHANGDVLDDLLGDAEAAFDLGDQRGGRINDEKDIEAVVELP